MNTTSFSSRKSGFTLIELLVAMAITATIVVTLLSITNVALDTWRRTRDQVKTNRIAQAALDQISLDFESMVIKSGNGNEWFRISTDSIDPVSSGTSSEVPPPSRIEMSFFSTAEDRYDGELYNSSAGGDICGVFYKLDFLDPIQRATSGKEFEIFSLYRFRVDPDDTFSGLLSQDDLLQPSGDSAATNTYKKNLADVAEPENFLVESIFGLTASFLLKDTTPAGVTTYQTYVAGVKSTDPNSIDTLRIKGNGLEVELNQGGIDQALSDAKIVSVTFDLTVLTEAGVRRIKSGAVGANLGLFLQKESAQFSRTIQIPGP